MSRKKCTCPWRESLIAGSVGGLSAVIACVAFVQVMT